MPEIQMTKDGTPSLLQNIFARQGPFCRSGDHSPPSTTVTALQRFATRLEPSLSACVFPRLHGRKLPGAFPSFYGTNPKHTFFEVTLPPTSVRFGLLSRLHADSPATSEAYPSAAPPLNGPCRSSRFYLFLNIPDLFYFPFKGSPARGIGLGKIPAWALVYERTWAPLPPSFFTASAILARANLACLSILS